MTVSTILALFLNRAPLLAQQAGASTDQASPGGLLGSPMVLPILMIVMLYFLMFRPQRQKQKEQENTQKSVQPGDEVVTIGGAHGVVTTVHEKTVIVRMAEGKIEFDRNAISSRRPKVSETEKV